MSSSATGVGMPICFLGAILLILTQKSSQKFGDVLGIMVWTTKETRAIPFKPQRLSLTEVMPSTKIPLWIPYQAQRLPFHLKSAREIGKSFNVDISFCWNSSWKSDFWKENLPFCSNCHDSFWRKSRNRSFFEVFSQKIVCAHKKGITFALEKIE